VSVISSNGPQNIIPRLFLKLKRHTPKISLDISSNKSITEQTGSVSECRENGGAMEHCNMIRNCENRTVNRRYGACAAHRGFKCLLNK
jgi:hypothetical protein